jgi:hypothetical protein
MDAHTGVVAIGVDAVSIAAVIGVGDGITAAGKRKAPLFYRSVFERLWLGKRPLDLCDALRGSSDRVACGNSPAISSNVITVPNFDRCGE